MNQTELSWILPFLLLTLVALPGEGWGAAPPKPHPHPPTKLTPPTKPLFVATPRSSANLGSLKIGTQPKIAPIIKPAPASPIAPAKLGAAVPSNNPALSQPSETPTSVAPSGVPAYKSNK